MMNPLRINLTILMILILALVIYSGWMRLHLNLPPAERAARIEEEVRQQRSYARLLHCQDLKQRPVSSLSTDDLADLAACP